MGGNPDRRAIRVFVSSTFRDMQAERDELVKRVFPRIRRLCEDRGLTWSEVDLRWGVTDEQKAEGAVLPICLAEIDRTRPYFIGLLGQRYGWVPDEIPGQLAAAEPWTTDDAGRSVTEMEIVHGVLDRDDQAGHAFFYLRDPSWLATVPPEELPTYVEASPEGAQRLATLRERVRTSGHPCADYADPTVLGELVLADLTALVDRIAPATRDIDRASGFDELHTAFGHARYRPYSARPDLERRLDDHAESTDPPLLLTGEAGVGTSALVTNWVERWHDAGVDIVVHHVDADSEAADAHVLVARLVGALDPDDVVESALDRLATASPARLRAAVRGAAGRSRRRTIVVLDGLDRLDDADRAVDLRWLPDTLPDHVRLVATGRGERLREAFVRRGWGVETLPDLTVDERTAVATIVLAASSKALDDELLDLLAAGRRCGNARFLTTVVDELRQHGDHFTLRREIERLTAVDSVDDLLELVLARYEADFDRDRPGLTEQVFTAIWAARHGMAESELRDLLGDVVAGDARPLPMSTWAPLHLAAERGLVSRGGLLGFAHDDLRRAVEDRYLADDQARTDAHRRLADWFAGRPLSPRVADELGWQLLLGGDLEGFLTAMSDLDHTELAYRRNPADVRRRWARYGQDSGAYGSALLSAYAPVIDDPEAHERDADQLVWGVARLLEDAGESGAALGLHRRLVRIARSDPVAARFRAALVNLGAAQLAVGDLDAAAASLSEAVERSRAHDDPTTLGAALLDLAIVHRHGGDVDAAVGLLEDVRRLAIETEDDDLLQTVLGERLLIHRSIGEYDAAIGVLEQQERVARRDADPLAIDTVLAARATILADRGDLSAAIDQMHARVELMRQEGFVRQLGEALLNLGVTLSLIGAADAADAALAEAEQHARATAGAELLPRVLVARSGLAGAAGEWERAERLAREAELTARASGRRRELALALGHLGTSRRERGDLAAAEQAHREEWSIASSLGDANGIANARGNLGNVAAAGGRFDEALPHYDAAIEAFRSLDLSPSMLPVLANRAQIHQAASRTAEAVADYADAAEIGLRLGSVDAVHQWARAGLQLAYQLGDPAALERLWSSTAGAARLAQDDDALQQALGEQALAVIARAAPTAGSAGDASALDEADRLLAEQESICRRIGHDVGLAACVGNQAIIARYRDDLSRSLTLLDEQLAIAGRSGNAQSALFATANRGEVLGLLGRRDEARVALTEARRTAHHYGLAPMVQQLDAMLAALG